MKEYRKAERDLIEAKRAAKKDNSFFVPAEPKLAFVVRIKGYVSSIESRTQAPYAN